MQPLYYKTSTLESIARNTLIRYDRQYLNREPQAVPLERIIEDVFSLNIDFVRLTMTGHELGRMIYDNGYTTCYNTEKDDYELMEVSAGTMLIESLLANDAKAHGRYRFTLAHELGHWLLHKQLYQGTGIAAASYSTDSQTDESTEWQANYLAKAILMPVGQLKRGFYGLSETNSKIKTLAEIFEVSKQAMKIRLKELRLV